MENIYSQSSDEIAAELEDTAKTLAIAYVKSRIAANSALGFQDIASLYKKAKAEIYIALKYN